MVLGTGLLINLGPTTDWVRIILFQVVAGIGAGPLFQAPMIAFQSHLPQSEIAAASSASMFLRQLSSSMSLVIGSVLLQNGVHGGPLTAEAGVRVTTTEYSSATKLMWTFYTAVSGLMLFASLFIEKMPQHDSTGSHTETSGASPEDTDKEKV